MHWCRRTLRRLEKDISSTHGYTVYASLSLEEEDLIILLPCGIREEAIVAGQIGIDMQAYGEGLKWLC